MPTDLLRDRLTTQASLDHSGRACVQVCRAPTGGMWGPAHVTPQLSCFLSASFTASRSLGLASCALSQFTARENRLGKDWEWGREGGRERVMQGSRSSLKQSEGAVFLHRLQRGTRLACSVPSDLKVYLGQLFYLRKESGGRNRPRS